MMTVALPAELEEFVNAKVQSGEYPCVSEVVHHSLYLLQDRDTLHQIKLERLRKDIAIGLEAEERGEVAPLGAEAIIAEGRKRLAEAKPQNG